MKKFVSVLSLALVALLVTSSFAQDAAEETKGKKKRDGARQNQLANQALKFFAKAELTDEQKAKVEAMGKEWSKKVRDANQGAAVSKEQRKKMQDARKALMEEGKKGKELQEALNAAGEVTDEQKAAMAKVAEIRKEFNAKVKELLTDDQKAKVQKKGKKGGKNKKKKEEAAAENTDAAAE